MSEVSPEELKPRPLTRGQLDFSLYVEKFYGEKGPRDTSWVTDFSDTAWELISKKEPLKYGNPIQARTTERLRQWVDRHRPEMLFFEPDEVMVLVVNNPNFIAEKEVKGRLFGDLG